MASSGTLNLGRFTFNEYPAEYVQPKFVWWTERNGYTSTVYYEVPVSTSYDGTNGTNHQWVETRVTIDIEDQYGNNLVSVDTGYLRWRNHLSDGANASGSLVSGSFNISHSYSDGTASFTIRSIKGYVFYYSPLKTYENRIESLDTISIGIPGCAIWDNNDDYFILRYWPGDNVADNIIRIYLKIGGEDPSTTNYDFYIEKSAIYTTEKVLKTSVPGLAGLISGGNNKVSTTIKGLALQYNGGTIQKSGMSDSANVIIYKSPSAPSNLVISTSNKYGKYTPSSKITFSWDRPSEIETIDGYRILIANNDYALPIGPNGERIFDRGGGNNTSFELNCQDYGITVNDQIYIIVDAYLLDGNGTKLHSAGGVHNTYSRIVIVADKNFIAYGKTGGGWKRVNLIHAKQESVWAEVANIHDLRR